MDGINLSRSISRQYSHLYFAFVFAVGVLVLAAQYESLALPLVVVSIVPLSILSALFGVWVSGRDNNIFTQVSLFVLAGLASKKCDFDLGNSPVN